MGAIGILPFNQVTANQQVFLAAASGTGAGVVTKPGMLNAVIINAVASFALYDAQVGATTNSTQFSGSVQTSASNLLASFQFGGSSSAVGGLVTPQIVDLNIPYKNGIVIVGTNTPTIVVS